MNVKMKLTIGMNRCVLETEEHLGGYGKVGFHRRLRMGLVGVDDLEKERY